MTERAEKAASRLIARLGIRDAQDLSNLAILAHQMGALVIEDERLETSIGRIVVSKDRAVIRIRARLDGPRKRFTIAHELGHFELHPNLLMIACREDHVFSRASIDLVEKEANAFAARFLLPTAICRDRWRGPPLHGHIKNLAEEFRVSFLATALRTLTLSKEPLCLVSFVNHEVAWAMPNKDWRGLLECSPRRGKRPSSFCVLHDREEFTSYHDSDPSEWGLHTSHRLRECKLRGGHHPLVMLWLG
jgi:Zn-dependent peptidase ImmA (M78 family)